MHNFPDLILLCNPVHKHRYIFTLASLFTVQFRRERKKSTTPESPKRPVSIVLTDSLQPQGGVRSSVSEPSMQVG